jgi:hypothetical protein
MLRISVVESPRRCRLVVEGKLVGPWTAEFAAAYDKAGADLHGREMVVDHRGLTAVGPEGEGVLLRLMRAKVRFRSGVFMREVLRKIASTSR